MRPFPRGAGEQAGGKQSARARRPRGLLAGRGAAGGGARPWQGLQGGWASRAPGKRSCLDALGVLWSVFRAQLCLLHLEAGGGGGDRLGWRRGACDGPPAGLWVCRSEGRDRPSRPLLGRQGALGFLAAKSRGCGLRMGLPNLPGSNPQHRQTFPSASSRLIHSFVPWACPPGRLGQRLEVPDSRVRGMWLVSDPDRRCSPS